MHGPLVDGPQRVADVGDERVRGLQIDGLAPRPIAGKLPDRVAAGILLEHDVARPDPPVRV